MKLLLSDDSPLATTITDMSGQALYQVHTPQKPGPRTTIIRRPRDAPPSYSSSYAPSIKSSQTAQSDVANEQDDQFSELASIEWHMFSSSKLKYEGRQVDLNQFMPNEKSWAKG